MVPTILERVTLVLDEPIPEVEAELDAADHEAHMAFLTAVREMVHGPVDDALDAGTASAETANAPAEDDLSDWLPGLRVDATGSSRGKRRRQSRRQGRRAGGAPAEYLARVEAPHLPPRPRRASRLRRTVRLGVVAVVLGSCVAVPWVAPGVPAFLGDLVPGGRSATSVQDPPVAPSKDAFVGPVGVSQQAGPYDGVRLAAAGPPREVVVDRLHVDSVVVPISGQSGSLLPPSDPRVLGWWREGKPAGAEYGSAVVTGHTVHTGGGALDHLDKLAIGDKVRVRTDSGWITYVVQRSQIYAKGELARQAKSIFRLGGSGRLVLITCDDWNGSFYESNAVVFASPVDGQPTSAN